MDPERVHSTKNEVPASEERGRPEVSVIVPTYQRPDLVARAVASVRAQTFPDLEIVIVDDGSTDETPAVGEKLAAADERVRYVRFEDNRGACAARNCGMEDARGRYLAFLDDDDVYRPDKLEKLVPVLRAAPEEVVLVYSSVEVRLGGGKRIRMPTRFHEGAIYEKVLAGAWFQTGSTLIRGNVATRWDETLDRMQDVDFHLKLLRGRRARYVDEVTAVWHADHGLERIIHDSDALERAVSVLERRHYLPHDGRSKRRAHSFLLHFVGRTLMSHDRHGAHAYFSRAVRLYPSWKGILFLMLNALPYSLVRRLRVLAFDLKKLIRSTTTDP